MHVFITGATGVLGRRAIPLMLERGHQVTAVGRSPGKRADLERLGARAIEVDLFDRDAVRRAVRGAEVICNLATAVPASEVATVLPWSWHETDRIRRHVSANLVDAALADGGIHRLIQESFAPIYADGGDAWLDETAAVRPARYNRTALDAEANAARLTRAGGAGVSLRFGFLYGVDDKMTMTIIDGVRRGWFALFGRPEGYCSWSEHGDTARAVVAALQVPAGIYNVVEDEPMRRRELANGIAVALGVRPPRLLPRWATPLGGVVGGTIARSLRISNRKLKRLSGWAPRFRTSLEGFEAVIESRRVAMGREVRDLVS